MARIAGINIPPQQHAEIGLMSIYGIGRARARAEDLAWPRVAGQYERLYRRLVGRDGAAGDLDASP